MSSDMAERVEEAVRNGSAVLRITDESSVIPLRSDGFTATAEQFDPPLRAKRWKEDYEWRWYDTEWRNDLEATNSICRHISGGWEYAEDVETDWISTTADLDWAVWEIARRLTIFDRDAVDLTVIRRRSRYSPEHRGPRAIFLDAAEHLASISLTMYGRDCWRFARASSEILFYGRIFRCDILETTTWTLQTPGFFLFADWLKPAHMRAESGIWTEDLAWVPTDSYATAKKKIAKRTEELRFSQQ
ncbi:hypothetical protein IAT40_003996 [Kwoniella sp. CBS 6097]